MRAPQHFRYSCNPSTMEQHNHDPNHVKAAVKKVVQDMSQIRNNLDSQVLFTDCKDCSCRSAYLYLYMDITLPEPQREIATYARFCRRFTCRLDQRVGCDRQETRPSMDAGMMFSCLSHSTHFPQQKFMFPCDSNIPTASYQASTIVSNGLLHVTIVNIHLHNTEQGHSIW